MSEEIPDWRAALPEDMRSAPLIAEADSLESLAKQALDMQAYQGQSLRIPSEHASDEDRAAFREKIRQHVPNLIEADWSTPEAQRELQRRMGLPEEATGYQRPDIPEGLDTGLLDTFTPVAHEAGLTQAQFEQVVGRIAASNAEAAQQAQAAHQEGLEALRKDWGFAFDGKLAEAKIAAKFFADAGLEAFAGDLTQLGAGTLQALAAMGAAVGAEATTQSKAEGTPATRMTPAEAESRLAEIHANPNHPMWSQDRGPAHDAARKEYSELVRLSMGPEGSKPHSVLGVATDDAA